MKQSLPGELTRRKRSHGTFRRPWQLPLVLVLLLFRTAVMAGETPRTLDEILATSPRADWLPLDPENTLYLEMPKGRVVIELTPDFAPQHVANVKLLAAHHFYDGMPIERVQDNRVVDMYWPSNLENKVMMRRVGQPRYEVPAEFDRDIDPSLQFTKLPDADVYAPEVGFIHDFPVARDPKTGKMWFVHSYGMVGCGRDEGTNSGGGFELYVVLGQPREWDRNYTLIGRVVSGMELLSALPRGTASHGEYANKRQWVPVKSARLAAAVPPDERANLEVLRTDGITFREVIEYERNRPGYVLKAGRVEIANVPIQVRAASSAASSGK